MLNTHLKNISKVLGGFTGRNGEPANDKEKYILSSMWIMLCSEFEGSVKNLAENYIDLIKRKKSVKDMHICFLVQNYYGDKEELLSVAQILKLFNGKKKDIEYKNFTKNRKVKNKSHSIENLFNSLGIFFNDAEKANLKLLDGIASTRDSIAHGDYGVSITRKQLEENIKIIKQIYRMLKRKAH
jgi:hypothetical protein